MIVCDSFAVNSYGGVRNSQKCLIDTHCDVLYFSILMQSIFTPIKRKNFYS